MLAVLTIAITAWTVVATVRRAAQPAWARVGGMVFVGLSTILGFLFYAGSGSTGVVTLTSTLVSTVAISTPLIFGSLSGVISERVGVVNIAIEGDRPGRRVRGRHGGLVLPDSLRGPRRGSLAGALLGPSWPSSP